MLDFYELYHSQSYQELLDKQKDIYGAKEIEDLIAIYEYNGDLYCGSYQLGKFGSQWCILSLNSPILGTSSYGNCELIDEDNYESYLKNLN